ncbi:MAG: gliding motility-associated C-terminal domain-containing protein [Saprospiraceae bacterium]|nr:gliding motility-associated C-terminal domain-containing protein [Saprospiraceae bacterium]
MMKVFTYTGICCCLALSIPMAAQQFLNGSFEPKQVGCRFGLSNGGFNARMPHVRSIGNNEIAGGLDVLSGQCGMPAAEGDFYLGLGISGNHRVFDMASLQLSQALIAGKSYTLSYSYKSANRYTKRNFLQFGIAQDSALANFGEQIHEFKGAEETWERRSFQFVAPADGRFIALKLKVGTGARIHLDNFQLECPTDLDLGPDTSYCVVEGIQLQALGDFEAYRWQDGSTESTYEVNAPGRYALEARSGECVLSDSIQIDEIEYNCTCEFYAPNAFSPNADGWNDQYLPVTPCELTFFDLQIFGRWGQMVFRSLDENRGWDGVNTYDYHPPGEYIYLLKYQFSYQEEVQSLSGSFLLMR